MKNVLKIAGLTVVLICGSWAYLEYKKAKKLIDYISSPEQMVRKTALQAGDIIFQTSKSNQSKAIQLATHSEYSHVGILYEEDAGRFLVLEAIQRVTLTPLDEWIDRGVDKNYVIKRLKSQQWEMSLDIQAKLKSAGEKYIGKNYDIYFDWSDDEIYCSELVWKMYYEATGLEIGTLEKLSDFDLSSDVVKKKLEERYGKAVPMDEKVISPKQMYESGYLITVRESVKPR